MFGLINQDPKHLVGFVFELLCFNTLPRSGVERGTMSQFIILKFPNKLQNPHYRVMAESLSLHADSQGSQTSTLRKKSIDEKVGEGEWRSYGKKMRDVCISSQLMSV